MKKNSVAVSIGQVVMAGQQIGLTGSSGYSSWPHLHFGSYFNGSFYEPHAGACRDGASDWAQQVSIRHDTYVFGFFFSDSGFHGDKGFPWDNARHMGTFLTGNRIIYMQFEGGSLPSDPVLQFSFRRPDGSTARNYPWTGTGPIYSHYVMSFAWEVSLNQTGTWRLLININGQSVIDAPFTVVLSQSEIVNRPPNPISLIFDPSLPSANEVLFCLVDGDLYRGDPDYDLVSYHYVWTENGAVIRDVTTAGMADALQRDFVHAGDTIQCSATPSDGFALGPTATVHVTVGGRHTRPLSPPYE